MAAEETTTSKVRWYDITPGGLLVVLLAVEVVMLLFERCYPKGWAVLIVLACVIATVLYLLLWFVLAVLFHWQFQFSIRSMLVLTAIIAFACGWMMLNVQKAEKQKKALGLYESCNKRETKHPSVPRWLREMLGEDFFGDINDETIIRYGPETKDADLECLNGANRLKVLDLAETNISDAGLEHLKELKQLISLDLWHTNITDSGLEQLKGLKQLERLDLCGTRTTDAGIAELQNALPNCRIDH